MSTKNSITSESILQKQRGNKDFSQSKNLDYLWLADQLYKKKRSFFKLKIILLIHMNKDFCIR